MKNILIDILEILASIWFSYVILIYIVNWFIEIAENIKKGNPKEARYYVIACVWFAVITIMLQSETKTYFATSAVSATIITGVNYSRAFINNESLFISDVTKRVWKTIKSVLQHKR